MASARISRYVLRDATVEKDIAEAAEATARGEASTRASRNRRHDLGLDDCADERLGRTAPALPPLRTLAAPVVVYALRGQPPPSLDTQPLALERFTGTVVDA